MLRSFYLALPLALSPLIAQADATDGIADGLILPLMADLADSGAALSTAAGADCSHESSDLQAAFHDALDAWVRVSHLRFGPTETDNRAFSLAFWPDSRSKTPKALSAMIAKENPAVAEPASFDEVSIAAQGYYALEFMLFDPAYTELGNAAYRCALVQAQSAGIADKTAAIHHEWVNSFAAEMRDPATRYRNSEEVTQELFKSLLTGLQMTADMRLGRPLGTFERPRPKRAEAYRSGRSLRHVVLTLESLKDFARALAAQDPDVAASLEAQFDKTLQRAANLQDPVFAGVADPATRFRVEALQQDVLDLHLMAEQQLGPALGVEAGFNSLDGD